MRALVLLTALTAIGIATPALAAPTTGPAYSLEFTAGDSPEVATQPNVGRYCGTWMNNGVKEMIIVFKLKRGKTFGDLAAEERAGTTCNPDMEAFYKQADSGIKQAQYTPRPFINDPFPNMRMFPRMVNPPGGMKKK